MKLVVSQSPLANFRTHASTGYGYFLNDLDTHGWPIHRRNDAWRLLRVSRMFQLASDHHLGSIAHHGADAPHDAGISFTAPAIANFFPRIFDPVHNPSGTTPTVSPYKGDYYFNGVGTLTAQTTARVFPSRGAWNVAQFTPAELANPAFPSVSMSRSPPANRAASIERDGCRVRERSPWAVLPTMHPHEATTRFRRYDISHSESHNLHRPSEPIKNHHSINP